MKQRTYVTESDWPFAPVVAVVDADDHSIEGRIMPGRSVKVTVYNANQEPRPFAVLVGEKLDLFKKFEQLQKLNQEHDAAVAEKKRASSNREHWWNVEDRQRSIIRETSEHRYAIIRQLGVTEANS